MVLLLLAAAGQPAALHAQSPSARTILDDYVRIALRENPALARRVNDVRRADAGVRETRGQFLPTIAFNARSSAYSGVIDLGDFINPAYAAINGLLGEPRFPTDLDARLPLRQETKLDLTQPLLAPALLAARDAAGAQRDLAADALASARQRLRADVQLTWLAYASAERTVDVLGAARLVLDENRRVSERLVSAGQATPDAVLRARAELAEIDGQTADAARQRNAARRRFNLLLGREPDTPIATAEDSSLVTIGDALPDTDASIADALPRRPELREAADAVRLATAQQRLARSAFLPTVALAASYGVQGQRYRFTRDADVGIASLVVSWNLFNGGQDVARRQQADLARADARSREREVQDAVRAQVGDAIDGLRAARASAAAAADRLAAAGRAFTLVEKRYAEGLATQVEFLSARAAFTSAALNAVITRFGLAARHVDFELATGAQPASR